MRSYLSLIPISAKVHRRQNRMTLLCIIFSVFMVTAIFSMAEMGTRMEQSRLSEKHGDFSLLSSNKYHNGTDTANDGGSDVSVGSYCRSVDDFQ